MKKAAEEADSMDEMLGRMMQKGLEDGDSN
jgi:hypothetical protein